MHRDRHENHSRIHITSKSELAEIILVFNPGLSVHMVASTRTETRDRRRMTNGGICVSTADIILRIVRKTCIYAAHTIRNDY